MYWRSSGYGSALSRDPERRCLVLAMCEHLACLHTMASCDIKPLANIRSMTSIFFWATPLGVSRSAVSGGPVPWPTFDKDTVRVGHAREAFLLKVLWSYPPRSDQVCA